MCTSEIKVSLDDLIVLLAALEDLQLDSLSPREEAAIENLRGRIRFIRPGADAIGPDERPPFGCCLLIWESPRSTGPSLEDLSQQAHLL